jgi:regulator of RNase E activity RraA
VFGDSDGAVVVPAARTEEILAAAFDKRAGEHLFRDAVLAGRSATDAYAEYGVL